MVISKHCQRHNGPEGWVLLTKETSSYTNLDQIPKIKIFRPNFNIKILTKHSLHNLTKPQQQNTDQTSVSKVSLELQLQTLGQTLCSKSKQNLALWPNFSFQNCIKLSSNISNSNKLNKFWVGIFTSHTSHQSSLLNRSEWVRLGLSYFPKWGGSGDW